MTIDCLICHWKCSRRKTFETCRKYMVLPLRLQINSRYKSFTQRTGMKLVDLERNTSQKCLTNVFVTVRTHIKYPCSNDWTIPHSWWKHPKNAKPKWKSVGRYSFQAGKLWVIWGKLKPSTRFHGRGKFSNSSFNWVVYFS